MANDTFVPLTEAQQELFIHASCVAVKQLQFLCDNRLRGMEASHTRDVWRNLSDAITKVQKEMKRHE